MELLLHAASCILGADLAQVQQLQALYGKRKCSGRGAESLATSTTPAPWRYPPLRFLPLAAAQGWTSSPVFFLFWCANPHQLVGMGKNGLFLSFPDSMAPVSVIIAPCLSFLPCKMRLITSPASEVGMQTGGPMAYC